MTENKIEKSNIKINWKSIWKKIKGCFNWIWKNIKRFWSFLKKQKIIKGISFLLILFSGLFIFLETLALGLIHSDKEKFAEILKYFFDFNLFDYLSVQNFYLISGGGYLIDMFFYLVILFLGVWGWKKQNYFKKTSLRIILGLMIGGGILLFSFGFYKAMPQIMIPLNKICDKYESRENNDWIIERKKYRNGYQEKGYLNDDNLKAYYDFIKYSF